MIAFLGTALYFLFEATAALSSGDGEQTNKVDLFFGVFISQESAFDFSGFIPPLELGVDTINNDSTILKELGGMDYFIKYAVSNGKQQESTKTVGTKPISLPVL